MANWIERANHAVGGLTEIGFIPGTEILLVLSSQGKGLFDCRTNTKIARDKSDYYYDGFYESCRVKGIGEFIEETITVGGFDCPDILSKSTSRSWEAIVSQDNIEEGQIMKIILKNGDIEEIVYQAMNMPTNRSYGFSDSGKTFVWARSSDLHIYNLDYGYKYENKNLIVEAPKKAMKLWTSTVDTIFQDQDEDLLFYNHECIMELITLCDDPNNLRKTDTVKIIGGYLKTLRSSEQNEYFEKMYLIDSSKSLELRIMKMINNKNGDR